MEEEALGDQLLLRPLVSHSFLVHFPSAPHTKTSGAAVPEHWWDSVMKSGLILPIAVSEFRRDFLSCLYVLKLLHLWLLLHSMITSVLCGHGVLCF